MKMDYWFVSLESLVILTSIWNMIGNIGQNTLHITEEFGISIWIATNNTAKRSPVDRISEPAYGSKEKTTNLCSCHRTW